jgi:hypothetical protein
MTIAVWPHAAAPVVDVAVPLLLTAFLAYTSLYDVSVVQGVLAFVLCWMPWASYRRWLQGDRNKIPLFPLVAAMFWLAYAVQLFWAQHVVGGIFGRRVLNESAVTEALLLAVLGVVCLWLGMRLATFSKWVPNIKRDVSSNPVQLGYLRVIFVLGTLIKVLVPITVLGAGGRQFVSSFEDIVPVVSFAIFARLYLRGTLGQFDKILIVGYGLIAVVVGISSGWLGSAVNVGLVSIVIYVYERRRFPVMAALIVLPVFLFFQPAKTIFRNRYWARESTDTSTQRVAFWIENSWQLWSEALTNQDKDQIRELSNSTLSRFDLMRQTAHVIESTPSRVPYQYGSLYSYVGVTFIPRFFWSDKPSVNDANRWYQVRYGLTSPHDLSSVSIAVGTVAESYINFGWLGPLLVILPLGIFLGTFERILLHADSGLLFSSLGAVLIPHLLGVEAQMAEYVAGLMQQIALVLLVLIPTLESRMGRKNHLEYAPAPFSLNPTGTRSTPRVPVPAIVQRQPLGK